MALFAFVVHIQGTTPIDLNEGDIAQFGTAEPQDSQEFLNTEAIMIRPDLGDQLIWPDHLNNVEQSDAGNVVNERTTTTNEGDDKQIPSTSTGNQMELAKYKSNTLNGDKCIQFNTA